MCNKDDWRLRGQEDYLQDATLYFRNFTPVSETWEHEHCEFCWAKFGAEQENLHQGYCTAPIHSDKSIWICSTCFNDFKEDFNWTVLDEQSNQSIKNTE